MLNGLDLFSGIAGISLALAPWVRPVAYCEIDAYCRAVLLSRMAEGRLPAAPVWDDVRTLRGTMLPAVDIIYGGFPCQDISVAGRGAGLAGERSGLFFEVLRLVRECCPSFIFLENVPAIRTRGGERVVKELAALGYDCRWDVLSAYDVGAPHKRERWFLLAHTSRGRLGESRPGEMEQPGGAKAVSSSDAFPASDDQRWWLLGSRSNVGDADDEEYGQVIGVSRRPDPLSEGADWWNAEPDVGRVAHGVPARVDRLRALGNAVVPLQAREAFTRLMGL